MNFGRVQTDVRATFPWWRAFNQWIWQKLKQIDNCSRFLTSTSHSPLYFSIRLIETYSTSPLSDPIKIQLRLTLPNKQVFKAYHCCRINRTYCIIAWIRVYCLLSATIIWRDELQLSDSLRKSNGKTLSRCKGGWIVKGYRKWSEKWMPGRSTNRWYQKRAFLPPGPVKTGLVKYSTFSQWGC